MKILDRYVLGLFLKNYIITLCVLLGMYIVMDMIFSFDDIVMVNKKVGSSGVDSALAVLNFMVQGYFYQSFMIFVQLSGIIPVVAAAFTLMRLSRFNELTAFLAAGVPLLRISMVIILASVLLNGLLIADQELILPQMIPQLDRTRTDLLQHASRWFPIKSMQVDQGSLLLAARYYPEEPGVPPHMEEIDVLERDADFEPVSHLFASRADWDAFRQQWTLTDGHRVTDLLPTQTHSAEMPVSVYKGTVTPEEIALYHSSASIELLSTHRINQLLARPKSYGSAGLYRVKHLRFTQPIMNVVLVLLAIPTVLTFDPKTLRSAATKCLVLTGMAMGSVFLAQQIAGHPPLGQKWINVWPALLAWLPIFVFAPLSVWLLDRVPS
jgi:lipopolysaccharide export system permease protein